MRWVTRASGAAASDPPSRRRLGSRRTPHARIGARVRAGWPDGRRTPSRMEAGRLPGSYMANGDIKVAITPAWPSRLRGRRIVLDQPDSGAVVGRSAQICLPHISGHENIYLSREAMRIGIDGSGRAYVDNLSRRHEAIIRPWGRGSGADDHVEHRRQAAPRRYLPRGVYWARNGRTWDPMDDRYGSARGNDRTSWVLIDVSFRDPLERIVHTGTPTGSNSGRAATYGLPDTPGDWRIQDQQYKGILVYCAQFLSWPPAVDPQIPTDSAVARLEIGQGDWSRIDHLVVSASHRGFSGSRNELLPWLINEGFLSFRQVHGLATQFGLLDLLSPVYRYRPPKGSTGGAAENS